MTEPFAPSVPASAEVLADILVTPPARASRPPAPPPSAAPLSIELTIDGATVTVRGRDLIVQGPERIAVTGDNGVGKSTLLEQLVGAPEAREHPLPETTAVAHVDRIAYLPQAADLDRSFPLPVYDLVAMGLWSRSGLFGGVGARERARVAEAMAAVARRRGDRRGDIRPAQAHGGRRVAGGRRGQSRRPAAGAR